uniref:Chaperone protein dnaJ n=1 Tax=Cajanus cajan TaxID=3821 RepID=A0A151SIV5_CAJCA|nr:Chaperone protein dnaJ [Cajanus cajan]
MECNKDEATRAREIAERKFAAKDTLGAKKFALKALNLFPALEGISQMIATLDVYLSAENKTNGEADWYGVLGVDPLADDDTVRKQYRKLALMLHPDKNKSVGADGAFKLISEAWSLLSDKTKRAAYDHRSGKAPKVSTKFGGSSTQTRPNGSYNFAKKTSPSNASSSKNIDKEHASSSTHKSKANTFWTVCHRCKMQYEYLSVYVNLKLLCLRLNGIFHRIIKISTAIYLVKANLMLLERIRWQSQMLEQGLTVRLTPIKKPVSSGLHSQKHLAYDKVKRDREEAQAASKREEALKRKQHASKRSYYNPAKRRRGGVEEASVSNHVGDISPVELRNLLVEKARKEISNKLKEIQSNIVDKTVVKESGNDFQKVIEKGENCLRNSEMCAGDNAEKSEDRKSGSRMIKSFASSRKFLETTPVDVPDPDFHDFFKDRTERSFDKNQVWAVYDNDDGMPRCYAMIHNIISLNPFMMQISWLNPNTNSTDGAISIYPRKGDVWAIYRNWSPDWNELTEDEIIRKFDVVEVLEDFFEGHGIDVIPLVKVAGYKTVFHHHLDPSEIRIIPREEMFRFSHQIPSHLLTGQEAPDAPKGCRVLDPAATPLELLQVIEVVKEEDMANNEDSDVKETNGSLKKDNNVEVVNDMGKLEKEKGGKGKEVQEVETLIEVKEKEDMQ